MGKIVRVGVLGAGGRMGQAVIAAVAADQRLKLSTDLTSFINRLSNLSG